MESSNATSSFMTSFNATSSFMASSNRSLLPGVSSAFETTTESILSLSCPPVGESVSFYQGSSVRLADFSGDLCTLRRVSKNVGDEDTSRTIAPVARAYDGRDWEVSAGDFAGKIEFDCHSPINGCDVILPSLRRGQFYELTTYESHLDISSAKDCPSIVARFLEQVTFGPTPKMLNSWGCGELESSFEEFVGDQIESVKASSHREFYRERLNPRMEGPLNYGRPGPHPCAANSRWRTFAFSAKDSWKTLTISALNGNGKSPYVLSVDGYVRTVVEKVTFVQGPGDVGNLPKMELQTPYQFCQDGFWYEESIGATVRLNVPGSQTCFQLEEGNPVVDLSLILEPGILKPYHQEGPIRLINLPNVAAGLSNIDDKEYRSSYFVSEQKVDEFILDDDLKNTECSALPDAWGNSTVLPNSEFPVAPVFGKSTRIMGKEVYLLYDPHLVVLENTIENPIPDGGGEVAKNRDSPTCSNAPRNFLNEDHCILSRASTACSAKTAPTFSVTLDDEFLTGLNELTGRYVYALTNLPALWFSGEFEEYIDDDGNKQLYVQPPCKTVGSYPSRWMRLEDNSMCTGDFSKIGAGTAAIFSQMLQDGFQDPTNPYPLLKDIQLSVTVACDEQDIGRKYLGHVLSDDGVCWRHVHPQHLNVYDFTDWVKAHPGGPNPIKNFAGKSMLVFPSHHHWNGNHRIYENIVFNQTIEDRKSRTRKVNTYVGKYGDTIPYKDLSWFLRKQKVEDRFGSISVNPSGAGVVVCGSIGEVANNPRKGSGFDFSTLLKFDGRPITTNKKNFFAEQRNTIWSYLALESDDQLRQRAAFALSQILVVTPLLIGDHTFTETTLQYYDIFVRHAFGNFRNILKEVSFSHVMGEMLSSIGSKSYQYATDYDASSFPDENFAREIMQLFTIGLVQLNLDGTPVLDRKGIPKETYDISDILSFSRAWTGFQRQPKRANLESRRFRTEPMIIDGRLRDVFPKSDLHGGYIGDRYPLCVDLPRQHFLLRGATYRLLGSKPSPELQQDWQDWATDPEVIRLDLHANSKLYQKLCDDQGQGCTFPAKVVLDSNLVCRGIECTSDTLRTVRIQSDPFPVYYEYIRQPCVEQAFFKNGKRVMDYASDSWEVRNNMCADPRRDVAAEGCCYLTENDVLKSGNGFRFCNYQGERLTFTGAVKRCEANDMEQCHFKQIKEWRTGTCSKGIEFQIDKLPLYYHWTTSSCWVKVKVARNGDIAIVHNPERDHAGIKNVEAKVAESTRNFFKVSWEGGEFPKVGEGCYLAYDCQIINDECLCPTNIRETPLFTTKLPTRDEILAQAFIGAFHPETFEDNRYKMLDCGGVTVHVIRGGCTNLDIDAIFFVVDDNGVERYLKNMKSMVVIADTFRFRNPVHFMSLVDPEVRDAYHETDAVLDSYFHHPNHPPFLAKNMIQRFGISNPSPHFVKTVAWAYKAGFYVSSSGRSFGSGSYGDLGAMVAAIVLEPESRSVSLDSDPSHGSLREPILKVIGLLRALSYRIDAPLIWPLLSLLQDSIGQCVYEAPSVFSFFLPEYTPSGPVGAASLVSPEAQVLSGSRITAILSGIFSTMNFGITNCHQGFGHMRPKGSKGDCPAEGDFKSSFGYLTHGLDPGNFDFENPSFADEVDKLSLLLTASRLHPDSRNIIETAMDAEYDKYLPWENKGRLAATRLGQMLIASTPEFHSTNIVQRNGKLRKPQDENAPSKRRYKAVVYLMFEGGMDSFNLLVPKDCYLYRQYADMRRVKTRPKFKLEDINATGSGQPCDSFGLNNAIPILKELYDSGEAMFLANAGVLRTPVGKDNWVDETKSLLFSHNSQQRETYRVDIDKEMGNTGLGGRIIDVLKAKGGFRTSAAFIGTQSALLEGAPEEKNPLTELPKKSPKEFYTGSSGELLERTILKLNGETKLDSGLFGETWSFKVAEAIEQNKEQLKIYKNPKNQVKRNFKNDALGNNLHSISQWILNRKERNVDREIFHVVHTGYDHHSDPDNNRLEVALRSVNRGLTAFVKEMKDAGLWNDIVLVAGSDFGRTLTPNSGDGTDHAWGGNYFMMGGNVKGGQIKGVYPDDLTEDGAMNIGRGRFIPSIPLDAHWNGIAQWLGVKSPCSLDYILPNRHNFECGSTLFSEMDLFRDGEIPHCGLVPDASCLSIEDTIGRVKTRGVDNNNPVTGTMGGRGPEIDRTEKDPIGSPVTGLAQRVVKHREGDKQSTTQEEPLPLLSSPPFVYATVSMACLGLVVGLWRWLCHGGDKSPTVIPYEKKQPPEEDGDDDFSEMKLKLEPNHVP